MIVIINNQVFVDGIVTRDPELIGLAVLDMVELGIETLKQDEKIKEA